MKGWSDTKPNNGGEKDRLDNHVRLFQFPDGDWAQMRFIGPIHAIGQHWISVKTKEGKVATFPKMCLDTTGDDNTEKSGKCPYCKGLAKFSGMKFVNSKGQEAGMGVQKAYYANAIIRANQENEPRKKVPAKGKELEIVKMLGHKCRITTPKSKTWTPVEVVRVVQSVANTLKSFEALNKVKKDGETQTYDVTDPRYGIDVIIRYDSSAKSPSQAYNVQREDRTTLTDEERQYHLFKLDALEPEDEETAKKEWASLKTRLNLNGDPEETESDEEEDDVEDDDRPAKSKKKLKDKKRSRDDDDDDEDMKFSKEVDLEEDDESDEEDEDDERDAPPKKSKTKSKSSRVADDEDDSDDIEEDDSEADDDEDTSYKPKSKSGKSSKKSSDDDEDDLDEEDEGDDNEGEDDEPPRRVKSKPEKVKKKIKKPSRDEDEDDDRPAKSKLKSKNKHQQDLDDLDD